MSVACKVPVTILVFLSICDSSLGSVNSGASLTGVMLNSKVVVVLNPYSFVTLILNVSLPL